MRPWWLDVADVAVPLAGGALVGAVLSAVLRRVGRGRPDGLGHEMGRAVALPVGWLAFVLVAWGGLSLWRPAAADAAGALFVLAVAGSALLIDRLTGEVVSWHLHAMTARTGATELHSSLAPLARQLSRGLLVFIALVIVLSNMGVNVSAFVATAGVASLAFGLAAQDTLANIFAGVTILFDRPFRVGDRIEVAGVIGDVVQIGLRSTRIRDFNNNHVVIPNKDVTANQLTNRAYPNLMMAIQAKVGVGYSTDIALAKQRMLDVLKANPEILADPAPAVYFTGFGDSALNLELWAYIGDYRRMFAVVDQVNEAILNAFRQAQIEMPFPQRVVTMVPPSQKNAEGVAPRPDLP